MKPFRAYTLLDEPNIRSRCNDCPQGPSYAAFFFLITEVKFLFHHFTLAVGHVNG